MPQELVLVRLNGQDVAVSRAFAKSKGLDVLDEDVIQPDGSKRVRTRADGRPAKKRVSVAKKVAEKKAAVIEPAPNEEEQNR